MYVTELCMGIVAGLLFFMLWQGFDGILVFFAAILIIAGIYF